MIRICQANGWKSRRYVNFLRHHWQQANIIERDQQQEENRLLFSRFFLPRSTILVEHEKISSMMLCQRQQHLKTEVNESFVRRWTMSLRSFSLSLLLSCPVQVHVRVQWAAWLPTGQSSNGPILPLVFIIFRNVFNGETSDQSSDGQKVRWNDGWTIWGENSRPINYRTTNDDDGIKSREKQ